MTNYALVLIFALALAPTTESFSPSSSWKPLMSSSFHHYARYSFSPQDEYDDTNIPENDDEWNDDSEYFGQDENPSHNEADIRSYRSDMASNNPSYNPTDIRSRPGPVYRSASFPGSSREHNARDVFSDQGPTYRTASGGNPASFSPGNKVPKDVIGRDDTTYKPFSRRTTSKDVIQRDEPVYRPYPGRPNIPTSKDVIYRDHAAERRFQARPRQPSSKDVIGYNDDDQVYYNEPVEDDQAENKYPKDVIEREEMTFREAPESSNVRNKYPKDVIEREEMAFRAAPESSDVQNKYPKDVIEREEMTFRAAPESPDSEIQNKYPKDVIEQDETTVRAAPDSRDPEAENKFPKDVISSRNAPAYTSKDVIQRDEPAYRPFSGRPNIPTSKDVIYRDNVEERRFQQRPRQPSSKDVIGYNDDNVFYNEPIEGKAENKYPKDVIEREEMTFRAAPDSPEPDVQNKYPKDVIERDETTFRAAPGSPDSEIQNKYPKDVIERDETTVRAAPDSRDSDAQNKFPKDVLSSRNAPAFTSKDAIERDEPDKYTTVSGRPNIPTSKDVIGFDDDATTYGDKPNQPTSKDVIGFDDGVYYKDSPGPQPENKFPKDVIERDEAVVTRQSSERPDQRTSKDVISPDDNPQGFYPGRPRQPTSKDVIDRDKTLYDSYSERPIQPGRSKDVIRPEDPEFVKPNTSRSQDVIRGGDVAFVKPSPVTSKDVIRPEDPEFVKPNTSRSQDVIRGDDVAFVKPSPVTSKDVIRPEDPEFVKPNTSRSQDVIRGDDVAFVKPSPVTSKDVIRPDDPEFVKPNPSASKDIVRPDDPEFVKPSLSSSKDVIRPNDPNFVKPNPSSSKDVIHGDDQEFVKPNQPSSKDVIGRDDTTYYPESPDRPSTSKDVVSTDDTPYRFYKGRPNIPTSKDVIHRDDPQKRRIRPSSRATSKGVIKADQSVHYKDSPRPETRSKSPKDVIDRDETVIRPFPTEPTKTEPRSKYPKDVIASDDTVYKPLVPDSAKWGVDRKIAKDVFVRDETVFRDTPDSPEPDTQNKFPKDVVETGTAAVAVRAPLDSPESDAKNVKGVVEHDETAVRPQLDSPESDAKNVKGVVERDETAVRPPLDSPEPKAKNVKGVVERDETAVRPPLDYPEPKAKNVKGVVQRDETAVRPFSDSPAPDYKNVKGVVDRDETAIRPASDSPPPEAKNIKGVNAFGGPAFRAASGRPSPQQASPGGTPKDVLTEKMINATSQPVLALDDSATGATESETQPLPGSSANDNNSTKFKADFVVRFQEDRTGRRSSLFDTSTSVNAETLSSNSAGPGPPPFGASAGKPSGQGAGTPPFDAASTGQSAGQGAGPPPFNKGQSPGRGAEPPRRSSPGNGNGAPSATAPFGASAGQPSGQGAGTPPFGAASTGQSGGQGAGPPPFNKGQSPGRGAEPPKRSSPGNGNGAPSATAPFGASAGQPSGQGAGTPPFGAASTGQSAGRGAEPPRRSGPGNGNGAPSATNTERNPQGKAPSRKKSQVGDKKKQSQSGASGMKSYFDKFTDSVKEMGTKLPSVSLPTKPNESGKQVKSYLDKVTGSFKDIGSKMPSLPKMPSRGAPASSDTNPRSQRSSATGSVNVREKLSRSAPGSSRGQIRGRSNASNMSKQRQDVGATPRRSSSQPQNTRTGPGQSSNPGKKSLVDKASDSVKEISKAPTGRKTSDSLKVPDFVERLKQGVRFGTKAQNDNMFGSDLTLEERIAASLNDAKSIGVPKKAYESTWENLRESRSKAQRRLSQSAYEQAKAAEKVENIRAMMEAEIRAVEEQLEVELDETQARIDQEVIRIMDLLSYEMELEVEREENLVRLVDSLEIMISDKEEDISANRKVAEDMEDVRSQLGDGMIKDKLDQLIDLKSAVIVIEEDLAADLSVCLLDLKELLEDARDRAARTRQAMEGLSQPPETRSSEPFDWSDIEEVELVLQRAADNVAGERERIRELSKRIDDALVNRALVLGEDVPPGLAKTAQRTAARSIQKALSLPNVDFGLELENLLKLKNTSSMPKTLSPPLVDIELGLEDLEDLKQRDEKELLTRLARSVGSATVDGSKAAFYGLKAVVDTMVTGASERGSRNQRTRQGGSSFLDAVGESESAQVAEEELRKTGSDLRTSVKTAAALGAKLLTFDKSTGRSNKSGPGPGRNTTGRSNKSGSDTKKKF